MAKYFVVVEAWPTTDPAAGPWFLIATSDAYDPEDHGGFPDESLSNPVKTFTSKDEACAERDRLNAQTQ